MESQPRNPSEWFSECLCVRVTVEMENCAVGIMEHQELKGGECGVCRNLVLFMNFGAPGIGSPQSRV